MSDEGDDLSGMTVNERLFVRGLLEPFDEARAKRDVMALREIFSLIDLPDYPVEGLLD